MHAFATSSLPLVLALDTATDVRGVAVVRGARTLALATEPAGASGASLVLSQIDRALREAGVAFNDVELFAVATGPGSFTGLRAGLATVKAFAAMAGRPIAGVPTLQAVACAAGSSPCTVAVLPAGRGEVFAQILGVATNGTVNELSRPVHIKPDLLAEEVRNYSRSVKWVGGGAVTHRELLRETAGRAGLVWREQTPREAHALERDNAGWTLITPVESYAEGIAKLGLMSSEKGMSVDAESLRAIYVRLSDAELKERCRV